MPIASTDEQLALQASIREWAKRARSIDLVRELEPRTPPGAGSGPGQTDKAGPNNEAAERWSSLADLGVFAVGLPAEIGGAGGTPELAATLAQLTESLVPGPILPTVLAAQALAGLAERSRHRDVLTAIASGHASVGVALAPAQIVASRRPDGTFELTGRASSVLGGGTTSHLLVSASPRSNDSVRRHAAGSEAGSLTDDGDLWFMLPADHPGVTLTQRAPADFSRSLADVELTAVIASPTRLVAGLSTGAVDDLAAALCAVEAAAVASWCTRTAADYAAIRLQFGRPIGSFQAVKHLCASMLCRSETAAALAWDAARAIGDGTAELPLIAAAAAAFNLDAAVATAKDCIQVLGGIGFTWEHDAHLYLRRALALRQLLGGAARWRDRTALLAIAGDRRQLVLADDSELADELAATRAAASEQAAGIAALPAGEQRRALADSGYAAPAWPLPYGLAASPAGRLIIDRELERAGLVRPDIVIGGWAIPAILGHGTPAQADRFAGPTLRGEITWCQLFSEPEAGSDLAALRTRADRADGGWLLTGQKVWTSLAREADWAICLARTDATAPKHKGLTYFLVAMDSPGIDIRPLREITGREMFNQVFLDQVFVPDDCVVAAPGDGWRAARTTLASERVAMGTGSSVGEAVELLLAATIRTGDDADPVVRQRLGELVASGMAVVLLDLQAVITQLRGGDPGPLAAVRKLVGVNHRQAVAEAAMELTGGAGVAADGPAGETLQEFLLTRCLSIAGGTTQILLSMVGERLLGLPREEAP